MRPVTGTARALLLELAKFLDSSRPADAIAAIESYLRNGRDVQTGFGFVISADGGTLDESPSIRAWLMDLLGRIDPVAAASHSRALLNLSEYQQRRRERAGTPEASSGTLANRCPELASKPSRVPP